MKIIEWLKLPEVKDTRSLDEPSATLLHGEIIRNKPFLKKIYIDFYNRFKKAMPSDINEKVFVELGSGGGFIKDIIPNAMTSDVIDLPNTDKHFSALNMPFSNNTVDGYFMFDVLHHISDSRAFFKEIERCLKIGGKIVMIEPANTLWSRFIFKNFHHEPFDPYGDWGFKKNGSLSSANGAIPWIIFFRDRKKFQNEFPSLNILKLELHTPFRYLVSGGVSMRQLLPDFTYGIIKFIEMVLSPFNRYVGMFLTVEIEKAPA